MGTLKQEEIIDPTTSTKISKSDKIKLYEEVLK
jgi:predicted transcriptional regulator